MSAAIKQRILADVRRRIEANHATYICIALDTIKELDHRRNIGVFCEELKLETQGRIAPFLTVGDWLTQGGAGRKKASTVRNLEGVRTARLALIDRMINDLKGKQ